MATNDTKIMDSSEYFRLPGNKMAVMQVFLPQDHVKPFDIVSLKGRLERGIEGPERKHFHAVTFDSFNESFNEVAFFDDNVITYYFNTQGGGCYIYGVVCLLDRLRDGWEKNHKRLWKASIWFEDGICLPEGGIIDNHTRTKGILPKEINGLRFEVETPSGITRPGFFNVNIKGVPAKLYFWNKCDFAWSDMIKGNIGDGIDYTIRHNLIEMTITEPGVYSGKYFSYLLWDIYIDLRHMAKFLKIAINHMSKCGIAEPRIIGDEIKDQSSFFEAAKADYETNTKPQR